MKYSFNLIQKKSYQNNIFSKIEIKNESYIIIFNILSKLTIK